MLCGDRVSISGVADWDTGSVFRKGDGRVFYSDRAIKLLSLLGKLNSGPALMDLLRGVIRTLCPERTVGGPDEAPGPIPRAVRSESCAHTFPDLIVIFMDKISGLGCVEERVQFTCRPSPVVPS